MNQFFNQSAENIGISLVPVQYESLYPALKKQYGHSFEPIVSEDKKTVILADPDFQEQGRVLIYKKSELGAYELPYILVGSFFENENGFGTAVDISRDGSVVAVMSECVTLIRYKKIQTLSGTVRIYTRTLTGQYLQRDHLFPRYIEESSDYGDQFMLSSDGKMLFVSAPNKENDASTTAQGSTGAVYTFRYDEITQAYKQHQLIRPPHEGISRFGQTIGSEGDGYFDVTDFNDNKYTFVFEKLVKPVLGFDSAWVWREEVCI